MFIVVVNRDPGDEDGGEDWERAGVVAHRASRLMRLGFAEALALQIAESDADVRQVASMVEQGYSLETAARIVL